MKSGWQNEAGAVAATEEVGAGARDQPGGGTDVPVSATAAQHTGFEGSAAAPPGAQPDLPDVLAYRLARPWERWCARLFDLWLETTGIGLVLGVTLGLTSSGFLRWLEQPGASKVITILTIPFALLLDAVIHALFGNTPGKAMLGLHVGLIDGRRLSLSQHCGRNMGVWFAGLGLGVPLVTPVHDGSPAPQAEQGRTGELR